MLGTTNPLPGTLVAAAARGVGTLTPTLTSGATPSPLVAASRRLASASTTVATTATTSPLTVTTTPTGAVMISNARH